MVETQDIVLDAHRAFVERLGLGILPLGFIDFSQVVQDRHHIEMV